MDETACCDDGNLQINCVDVIIGGPAERIDIRPRGAAADDPRRREVGSHADRGVVSLVIERGVEGQSLVGGKAEEAAGIERAADAAAAAANAHAWRRRTGR